MTSQTAGCRCVVAFAYVGVWKHHRLWRKIRQNHAREQKGNDRERGVLGSRPSRWASSLFRALTWIVVYDPTHRPWITTHQYPLIGIDLLTHFIEVNSTAGGEQHLRTVRSRGLHVSAGCDHYLSTDHIRAVQGCLCGVDSGDHAVSGGDLSRRAQGYPDGLVVDSHRDRSLGARADSAHFSPHAVHTRTGSKRAPSCFCSSCWTSWP